MPFWRAAVALSLARLALCARFDLSPDEAYYLTWAQGSSGHDHPPLIGWLARVPLALGVHPVELAARVIPVLCALVSTLALDALLAHLDASPRARWTLLVVTLLPLPATGALLLTPDAPLLALGSVALFVALSPRVSSRIRAITLTLCAGLMVLAKVNALMLVPALLIALRPRERWWVPMLGAQAAALGFALPSLVFQLQHAFSAQGPVEGLGAPPPFPLAGLPIFVSGQLGLLLPSLALGLRRPRSPVERALAAFIAVQTLPVLVSALVRIPEPNWTAPAWPAVLVYLALGAEAVSLRVWRASVSLTLAVAVALHLQVVRPFLPIAHDKDQSARLHGWKRWVCEGGPLPVGGLPPYATRAEREIYAPLCDRPQEDR